MTFLLSPAARADLAGIWRYTAQRWDQDQAERYTGEIVNACSSLADGRRQGRTIDDIRKGYFKLAVGSHFLIYRLTSDGMFDIVRILHQRMDIPERLQ
jgi:toxin ParE1/3/4